jgi:hypothetical protein
MKTRKGNYKEKTFIANLQKILPREAQTITKVLSFLQSICQ